MRVHISLKVTSVEKSTAFYSALFGQEVSKRKDDYANFRLDEPPVHLALVESTRVNAREVSHFGIELPTRDDLQSWQKRLDHLGIEFATEDEANCCYALADKLWVTDPDGYRWELWLRTGGFDGMGKTQIGVNDPCDCRCSC